MKISHRDRVLATICYADIFDFPLTPDELLFWCIGEKGNLSGALPSVIAQETDTGQSFLYVKKRRSIIKERARRFGWAKEKWDVARRVSRWLFFIPTIDLVGVTGGLAMHNAKKDDDIDMFFIVRSGTLWTSRLLATIVVELLGMRRRPNETRVRNKICLNMFMSDDALSLSSHERDLFAAHEVLQMHPLWKRGGVYRKFLSKNNWVRKFLPHAWREKRYVIRETRYENLKKNIIVSYLSHITYHLVRLFEMPFRFMQLWYMHEHRTTEIVTDNILRFHPNDARVWIKKELEKRLHRYNIPLVKIFYAK